MMISIRDSTKHRPERTLILGVFNLRGLHPRTHRAQIEAQAAGIERAKHQALPRLE